MALPVRQSREPSAPARRDPFDELDLLQDRLRQLLQAVIPGDRPAGAWVPPVDIEETDDAWIVEAELPGVRREDVHVEVRDDELAIYGEVVEREREGMLRRKTRRVGEFDLHVSLPGTVEPEDIDASLDAGVLTIRVPKPARTQPRRIEVGQS